MHGFARRLVVSLALLAPSPTFADESVGSTTQPVVYTVDDRVDWYAIPSAPMQTLARQSIVALVPDNAIDLASPGVLFPPFLDAVGTLDEYVAAAYGEPLCPAERFRSQPAAAICSGTLIDDDLVLTAGHCVRNQAACEALRFVFDYLEVDTGVLEDIDTDDVYGCKRVLAYSERSNPHLDFAVVQLDRPVVGRTPVDVRSLTTPLAAGTPLVVIGFGSGIPMKYDDGGSVIDPSASLVDAFVADTDTFGGNSGSGVFTDDGTLVGILVSGAADYEVGSTCTTVAVLPSSAAAEECTYAFRPLAALCDGGFPSAVCPGNAPPSCGDSFCSGGESASSCAADCAGPHCADGVCTASLGEDQTTCPYDCAAPTLRRARGRCSVNAPGSTAGGVPSLAAALAILGVVLRRRR